LQRQPPRWEADVTAVWMRFQRELRARWLGWLAVAVLTGIAGGLVLTAAAGARRTHSVLARHLAAYRFPDAKFGMVNNSADNSESYARPTIERIRSLPQVETSAVTGELAVCARDAQNRPVPTSIGSNTVFFTVNVDGRYGVTLARPKILAGRAPDPARPREVLLDSRAAKRFGVGPGDLIPIRVFPSWDPGVFRCDPLNPNPQPGVPERREVRQILLACSRPDECRGAKALAEHLYARLRGGASFARLAARYSDFPDAKATGGKLWIVPRSTPVPSGCCQTVKAFDRVAFGLRVHELSRPFKTRFGWHIVQPLSKLVPGGPLIRLRVVGVKATTDPYPVGTVTLTPAFHRAHWVDSRYAEYWISVRLRHGAADIPALQAVAGTDVVREADDTAKIQPAIDHQAQALWLAAGFGALLALILLASPLLRLASVATAGHLALRALGMTRRQLVTVDVARAAAIGAFAAVTSVAVAFALSTLTPIGLARELEPDPGFTFDRLVLPLGGSLVLLAVVLAGAAASAQATQQPPERPPATGRPLADALARWGLPLTAVSGVRMALTRGRGTTAVPIAGTLLGAVAAVAVVAVALTFTASLDHLFSTPRLYGQNWDYATNYSVPSAAHVRADRAIRDAARGGEEDVLLDGRRVHLAAMDDIKGRIGPVVTEGRQPEGSDEIVLTRKVLDALGAGVGDTVEARLGTHSARMRIVGRAVMPESVCSCARPRGAMTFQAFKQLSPHAQPYVFEARVAPRADRIATVARLERAYIHPAPGPPKTIADFEGVRNLPVVVSALLAAIAAATLAHTLVTAIRRRRRHLAVLKTLGFDRRQLLLTVAWQATTFAAIGVVVGLPLGIAAGRWTWYLFAQQIEVVPEPVTPVPLVLLVVPAAVLLANLVAALPGWSAAQTRAAAVLRAE
jgi:PPIC-type PPIASE domain/FtsX-like permease family